MVTVPSWFIWIKAFKPMFSEIIFVSIVLIILKLINSPHPAMVVTVRKSLLLMLFGIFLFLRIEM